MNFRLNIFQSRSLLKESASLLLFLSFLDAAPPLEASLLLVLSSFPMDLRLSLLYSLLYFSLRRSLPI